MLGAHFSNSAFKAKLLVATVSWRAHAPYEMNLEFGEPVKSHGPLQPAILLDELSLTFALLDALSLYLFWAKCNRSETPGWSSTLGTA